MDNSELYEKSILLIGPSGAGKSTVAEELHKMTDLPRLCLDGIANRDRQTGFTRRFRNADEYHSYMIKTVLDIAEKHGKPGVVDFGAGHSVYDSIEIFNEVKNKLRNFKNIILLIPSVDIEKSLRIMEQRSTGYTGDNRKFITSSCNRELATITIYGNDKTPKEIADEILKIIEKRQNDKEDNKRNYKS